MVNGEKAGGFDHENVYGSAAVSQIVMRDARYRIYAASECSTGRRDGWTGGRSPEETGRVESAV
jgi:hypothetical protein